MFRLHWGVVARNEKGSAGEVKIAAATKQKVYTVENQMATKMKRKRRDSDESVTSAKSCKFTDKKSEFMSHVEVAIENNLLDEKYKRQEERSPEGQNGTALSSMYQPKIISPQKDEKTACTGTSALPDPGNKGDHELCQKPADDLETKSLQEAIETQFSLEILLKHNELRLIEQELAKCQIALEQLRRCRVIPFPAFSSSTEDMLAVSSGLGSPIGPLVGRQQAQRPPPWGVSDGPYSRHYAKWLLPDPTFDGAPVEEPKIQQRAGKKLPERTTRGSKADKQTATPITSSRSQRGSVGLRLHALPAGYPEPKEEKGPMIVKRSTDGQMVKLVCLDCRRENFNSAQGFINHCRIAHSRGFASHDAAALACGEEVELNETGGVIADSSGAGTASAGLVHPLIRSALVGKSAQPSIMTTTNKRKRTQPKHGSFPYAREVTAQSHHAVSPFKQRPVVPHQASSQLPFVPSPNTPHLSALFAKSGLGGNLNELVKEATTKPALPSEYLSESEDENSDVEIEDATPPGLPESHHLSASAPFRDGRPIVRATMSPAPLDCSSANKRPDRSSRKPGYLNNISLRPSYSSPYTPSTTHHGPSSSTPSHLLSDSSPVNLSPNTVESNTAPSLVSDDEDYDNAHSESDTPSSAADDDDEDGYPDIEVEDEEVGGSSVDPELATAAKAHPARRSSALRSPATIRGHGERHVTFQSPVKKGRRGEGQRDNK